MGGVMEPVGWPGLRRVRKEAGLTLRALADLVGCSHNALWMLEAGLSDGSVRLLRRVAEVLGVRPGELLE